MAVFYGTQLQDWRVKILRGKWSKLKLQKALSVITDWIERYRPGLLAIKRFHPSRTSRGLDTLVIQLRRLCLTRRLTLTQYSIKQLESIFCQEGKRNKRSLSEAMAAHYPELYPELHIEKTRKNSYHVRMFEAVALGAMSVSELRNL